MEDVSVEISPDYAASYAFFNQTNNSLSTSSIEFTRTR